MEEVATGELTLVFGRIEIRDRVDDVELRVGPEVGQHLDGGLAP